MDKSELNNLYEQIRKMKEEEKLDKLAKARAPFTPLTLLLAQDCIRSVLGEIQCDSPINLIHAVRISNGTLDKYATLDIDHIEQIESLKSRIREYSLDPTRKRPLNVILRADAGLGKSQFVKSLSKSVPDLADNYVPLNMANTIQVHDFVPTLEVARNRKAEDQLPILFLDEFDAYLDQLPLLLPLLWDGEMFVDGRILKLGRAIIVLAASRSLEELRNAPKSDDFFSRINSGCVILPGLDEVNPETGRDRRLDKVCILISLLRKRFGSQLVELPCGLLKFVGLTRFRWSVRSLGHLVETLTMKNLSPHEVTNLQKLDRDRIELPVTTEKELEVSGLLDHLEVDDPKGLSQRWNEFRQLPVSALIA